MRGRIHGAVPTYQLDLTGEHWSALLRTDQAGQRFLAFGALAETTFAAAQDCLGGRFGCVEDAVLLEPLPLDADRTVQLVVLPVDDGHALWECRSVSATEEAAGAPWRLHVRGILRRRATTSRLSHALRRPPVLDPTDYGHTLDVERVALSETFAAAFERADRGDDGVLVALTGQGSWVAVIEAAVAAAAWAARPETLGGAAATDPAPPGRICRMGGLSCSAPEDVRYVRADARQVGTDEIVGTADFGADGGYLGGAEQVLIDFAPPPTRQAAGWRDPGELLYDAEWVRLAEPADAQSDQESVAGEGFLILADRTGLAEHSWPGCANAVLGPWSPNPGSSRRPTVSSRTGWRRVTCSTPGTRRSTGPAGSCCSPGSTRHVSMKRTWLALRSTRHAATYSRYRWSRSWPDPWVLTTTTPRGSRWSLAAPCRPVRTSGSPVRPRRRSGASAGYSHSNSRSGGAVRSTWTRTRDRTTYPD